jgi:hypothetical protein
MNQTESTLNCLFFIITDEEKDMDYIIVSDTITIPGYGKSTIYFSGLLYEDGSISINHVSSTIESLPLDSEARAHAFWYIDHHVGA